MKSFPIHHPHHPLGMILRMIIIRSADDEKSYHLRINSLSRLQLITFADDADDRTLKTPSRVRAHCKSSGKGVRIIRIIRSLEISKITLAKSMPSVAYLHRADLRYFVSLRC